jgi:hypothetical protein
MKKLYNGSLLMSNQHTESEGLMTLKVRQEKEPESDKNTPIA